MNMNKKLIFAAMLCLTAVMGRAEQVTIETKQMTLVLDVEQGRQPQYVYFGQRLSTQELQHLQAPRNGRGESPLAFASAPAGLRPRVRR